MFKRIVQGGAVASVLLSTQAFAVPFSSLDARSYAMGGTGVAAAKRSNAALMNPAMLTLSRDDERFNLELPILGGQRMDEKGGMSEAKIYQDRQLEAVFNQRMDAFAALDPADPDFSDNSLEARIEIARSGQAVINQLVKMSDKVVQGETFIGAIAGGGNDKIDVALLLDSRMVAGGYLRVQNSDIASVQAIIDLASSGVLPQSEPFRINAATMDSAYEVRGAMFDEVALSVSREVTLAGQSFALGLTPKHVTVTVFDYITEINDARFDKNLNTTEYSGFNIDVGVAKHYDNGWTTGLVLKDLVAHDYPTVLGNSVKIRPQARAGIARKDDWTTLTVDLDLTKNEGVGYDSETRYIAFGAELEVTEITQMRLGYRHNLTDNKTSALTLGAGFLFSSTSLNLAVGLNEDALGLAMQLGVRF